jgi:Tfp pilus assembly protein PilE
MIKFKKAQPYRMPFGLTLLQFMAVMAILGIAATLVYQYWH